MDRRNELPYVEMTRVVGNHYTDRHWSWLCPVDHRDVVRGNVDLHALGISRTEDRCGAAHRSYNDERRLRGRRPFSNRSLEATLDVAVHGGVLRSDVGHGE